MTDKTVLVTGISGFIAKHVAIEFLNAGYAVRGTIREKAREDGLSAMLSEHADTSRLSLVVADLTSDAGWDAAMEGAPTVVHVASPFPLQSPRDEIDVIRPALDGTLRVMNAAAHAGVRRIVQTSSIAAVMYGHDPALKQHFTNKDWTIVGRNGVSAYAKSKTLAERAARDFVLRTAPEIHFSSINPGLVLGPLLDQKVGSSALVIQRLMQGKYPAVPRFQFPVVDVRDVARMHRLAAETDAPGGGRFIAVAGVPRLVEMCRVIHDRLGNDGKRVPLRELPDFVVRLLALFDKTLAQTVDQLGQTISIDTAPSEEVLGIEFTPAKDAVTAMAASLKIHGLI